MPINQTFNGIVYAIPVLGDKNWAPPLTRYLIALGSGALAPTGGTFPLTADINFGPNFGLLSKYFETRTALPATSGLLRLAKTDTIEWRNNANSGDNILAVDGLDNLTYNGTIISNSLSTLADGKIWVGNSFNVPTAQTLTGDVTISDTGVTAIGNGKVINAMIAAAAGISYSKLTLASSIVNNDINGSAAIAYSKLLLTNSIQSGDIASGQVVKSINTLTDAVTLAAGSNITLTPSGNTITVAASIPSSVPTWAYTGSLPNPNRSGFAYGIMQNGQVMVAGGDTPFSSPAAISDAALYNPATGLWTKTGSLNTARRDVVGIGLANGKFLVIGGAAVGMTSLATCELYDPTTGVWTATGSMGTPRQGIVPILLQNGKVLVTCGRNNTTILSTAELYDPIAGTWSATTGAPTTGRSGYGAYSLNDGTVLIVGGENPSGTSLTSCEIYDPVASTFSSTGSTSVGHNNLEVGDNFLVRLFDGTVLLAGGISSSGVTQSKTTEVYDPVATTWGHTAVTSDQHDGNVPMILSDGSVLLASGHSYPPTAITELYNPATFTWSTTTSPNTPRLYAGFVKITPGRVLMFGGDNSSFSDLVSAEIFHL